MELIILFFIAFSLNLIYELLHSLLYTTCRRASLEMYVYLMLKGAVFDGFAIVFLYLFASFIAVDKPLAVFIPASLIFAWIWEVIAIKYHRWEYAPRMPRLLGVGLTPLLQLAITGFLAIQLSTLVWFM